MPKAKVVCRTSNKLRELRDKKNSVIADPSDYIVFEDKDEDQNSTSLHGNKNDDEPEKFRDVS